MPEHPCANGLTAACFKAYPDWARQALAYKLLHIILSHQLTRMLPRMPIPPGFNWQNSWNAWLQFIFDGYGLPWDFFPKDWKPGDPLPPGVTLPPGATLPPDFNPDDHPPKDLIPGYSPIVPPHNTGPIGPIFTPPFTPGPPKGPGGIICPPEQWPPMEPLSAYVLLKYGTGTISYASGKITISSNSGISSGYYLRKWVPPPPITYSWEKDRSWGAKFSLQYGNETGEILFAGLGYNPIPGRGIVFVFTDTAIIGRTGDGTSSTSINLVTGLVKPYTSTHAFKINYTAATKAEFYIDNVKKGEITTTLPHHSSGAQILLNCQLVSTGAILHKLILSSFKTTQVT